MSRDAFLKSFLRLVGAVAGTAAFCAVMPFRWMDAVHRTMGLGALPSEPVVVYLARSTSAFYALMGGLLWVLSSDLDRYRPLTRRAGVAFVAMGFLLLWVDATAGLPWFWRATEGPIDIALGSIIVWASRPRVSGAGASFMVGALPGGAGKTTVP